MTRVITEETITAEGEAMIAYARFVGLVRTSQELALWSKSAGQRLSVSLCEQLGEAMIANGDELRSCARALRSAAARTDNPEWRTVGKTATLSARRLSDAAREARAGLVAIRRKIGPGLV